MIRVHGRVGVGGKVGRVGWGGVVHLGYSTVLP